MYTLSDHQQPRLPFDRVVDVQFRELVECCLCHGVLWHPVACKTCDKTVCSTCIATFNSTKSQPTCPGACSSYVGCSCPKAISHVLSTLNISCRYKPNGCPTLLPYHQFEAHEDECDYQLFTCNGCQEGILKKDFSEHTNQCQFVLITCDQCSTVFQRKYADLHTSTECLRIQLQEQISKIKQLEDKETEQRTKIEFMERKLQSYENFWMGFSETTKQIRDMFDEEDNPDQILS